MIEQANQSVLRTYIDTLQASTSERSHSNSQAINWLHNISANGRNKTIRRSSNMWPGFDQRQSEVNGWYNSYQVPSGDTTLHFSGTSTSYNY